MNRLKYLFLLTFSTNLLSDEFKYRFDWFSLPVADLTISYEDLIADENMTRFSLKSRGPLSVYRHYQSNGYIRKINEESWYFYLNGYDRNIFEEKKILYNRNDLPLVEIFSDDSGVKPLKTITDDIGAIDSFSLLIQIMKNLQYENNCGKQYYIYDGKRRYRVKSRFIKKEIMTYNHEQFSRGEVFLCNLEIKQNIVNPTISKKRLWPFNDVKREVKIWFARSLNFSPVKFQFKSPIGNITGELSSIN